MSIGGSNNVVQNVVVDGAVADVGDAGAIINYGHDNTVRFNTIRVDPATHWPGAGIVIKTRSGAGPHVYGNVIDSVTLTSAIDLDGFRTLNAKHGFMAGDDALCAVAKTLRTFTRAHDVCARSGPDEFAVMMPETDPAGAMACFERILLELEVAEAGPVNGLSASVGIAACSRDSPKSICPRDRQ